MLVTTEERDLAKQYDVRAFPALGLFKNGEYLGYEGDLHEEMDILEWITDRPTLGISGKIEKVQCDENPCVHLRIILYRISYIESDVSRMNIEITYIFRSIPKC